ncbi:unnamed protein product [Calypogeia fissa]
MQFSVSDGLVPMQGCKVWDIAVEDGLSMEGPRTGNKAECEVLMMFGLFGKTTWAENWSRDHPDKRYVIIGTNLTLDQMKVPGLQRKQNWDLVMSRAIEIFNSLLERAASTPRNYITDNTNLYRKQNLKLFPRFRKIMVVVAAKEEEQTLALAKDLGNDVAVEALDEMKAYYLLPIPKDMADSMDSFDVVRFVETQRQEVEKILLKDNVFVQKSGRAHRSSFSGGSSLHEEDGKTALQIGNSLQLSPEEVQILIQALTEDDEDTLLVVQVSPEWIQIHGVQQSDIILDLIAEYDMPQGLRRESGGGFRMLFHFADTHDIDECRKATMHEFLAAFAVGPGRLATA